MRFVQSSRWPVRGRSSVVQPGRLATAGKSGRPVGVVQPGNSLIMSKAKQPFWGWAAWQLEARNGFFVPGSRLPGLIEAPAKRCHPGRWHGISAGCQARQARQDALGKEPSLSGDVCGFPSLRLFNRRGQRLVTAQQAAAASKGLGRSESCTADWFVGWLYISAKPSAPLPQRRFPETSLADLAGPRIDPVGSWRSEPRCVLITD